jgi:hypothetical protein
MGDRCSVTLTLNGHLETGDQVEKLFKVLATYDYHPRYGERPVAQQMADQDYPIEVYCDEVNYGNTEDLEGELEDIEGLAWSLDKGAGGGYGPSSSSYSPDRGFASASNTDYDGDPCLTAYSLREMLVKPNPLREIREWLQEAAEAQGLDLPDLTLGEDAKRAVAAAIAKGALEIA